MPAVCKLVQAIGDVTDAEMWDVFNMGCGFVAAVPGADAPLALCSAPTIPAHVGSAR